MLGSIFWEKLAFFIPVNSDLRENKFLTEWFILILLFGSVDELRLAVLVDSVDLEFFKSEPK